MTAKIIPSLTAKDRERFADKFSRGGDGGCWPWAGTVSGSGYGVFYLQGSMYQAHRVAVKLDGYAVPTEMVIDHTCRNRICVNPAHLRTVDRFTNVHENSDAPAHINALKTHCLRGHPLSGENLRMERGWRVCRECRRIRAKGSTDGDSPVAESDAP